MSKSNEHDSYIIPPNFIDSGSFFGGMFKARNTIEAGVLLLAVGIPVFSLGVSITTKIIILCLTALPLALFALIGIGGESLSSFAIIFLRYLRNRRVVGVQNEEPETITRPAKQKTARKRQAKQRKQRQEDFPAEFDEMNRYSRKRRVRERLPQKEKQPRKEKVKKADKRPEPPHCSQSRGWVYPH